MKTKLAGILAAGALSAAILATPARAEGVADFIGTWVAIGEPLGLVVAHIEEMRVAPDGAVEVIVHRQPYDAEGSCDQPVAERKRYCQISVVASRGTLKVDGEKVQIDVREVPGPAFPSSTDDKSYRNGVGIGGGRPVMTQRKPEGLWVIGFADTSRGPIGPFLRRFYRVDNDFARDYYDYASFMESGLSRGECVMRVLALKPADFQEFRTAIAMAARLERAIYVPRVEAERGLRMAERDGKDVAGAQAEMVKRLDAFTRLIDLAREGAERNGVAALAMLSGVSVSDINGVLDIIAWQRKDKANVRFGVPAVARNGAEIAECWKDMGVE